MKPKSWTGCPIRFGMGVFGDKWTLLVIRDMMFKGKRHFGEFTAPEENIATNILADRLKKLEKNGIVTKRCDPSHLSRFIYELTDKGLDLLPMMLSIVDWAEKYDELTEVPENFIRDLRKNPAKFEQALRKKLKSSRQLVARNS